MQNLDEGQPWLGVIRHLELLDQYGATSAQHENPVDLGFFPTPEEAHLAIERDALHLAGRRAYAIQLTVERRARARLAA